MTAYEQLTKLVDGLTYPSESDEPITVFQFPAELVVVDLLTTLREGDFLSDEQVDTDGSEDTKFWNQLVSNDCPDAAKWKEIRRLINHELEGGQIYRQEQKESEVTVIAAGRNKQQPNEILGFKTMSVET